MALRDVLAAHDISQKELALGIGKSDAVVSRMLSGEVGIERKTINAILGFLSARLKRRVTYEQAFSERVTQRSGRR